MSRLYEMRVRVTDFKKRKLNRIEKACLEQWSFDSEEFSMEVDSKSIQGLTGKGIGALCGGESEEEFADRLAVAIWKANGGYCEVEVQALYLEDMPYEQHVREEDDYKRLMNKGR